MAAQLGEYRRSYQRGALRKETRRSAALRTLGASGRDVVLRDLSTHGFAVEGEMALAVGTFVWLRLPGGMGLNARVAWRRGARHGCEFIIPISQAMYEAALTEDTAR